MVDSLRYELTQVVRKCPGIALRQPELNKILNGKYEEIINSFLKEPVETERPKEMDELNKRSAGYDSESNRKLPSTTGTVKETPKPKKSTKKKD